MKNLFNEHVADEPHYVTAAGMTPLDTAIARAEWTAANGRHRKKDRAVGALEVLMAIKRLRDAIDIAAAVDHRIGVEAAQQLRKVVDRLNTITERMRS